MSKKKKLNRIKAVLFEKEISQRWLAKQMGVTPVAINSLVNNRTQPSLAKLYQIAEILEVDICDLLISDK